MSDVFGTWGWAYCQSSDCRPVAGATNFDQPSLSRAGAERCSIFEAFFFVELRCASIYIYF